MRAAPMTQEDLSAVSTMLFRVQGEIDRQAERFGPVWAKEARTHVEWSHGVVLAMMTFYERPGPGYSVRIPVEVVR